MRKCTQCNEIKSLSEFYKKKDSFTSRCKKCSNIASKAWQIAHPIQFKAGVKKWKDNNPDKVRAMRETWLAANIDRNKARQREYKYGITQTEFNKMMGEQNGLCKICGMINDGKALTIDHCHKTNRIRGLLCSQCNRGLGIFKDNAILLLIASHYVS